MIRALFFYILFFISSFQLAQAQNYSERYLWIPYETSSLVPDSLTIDPQSISIKKIMPDTTINPFSIQLSYDIDANYIFIDYSNLTHNIDSFLVTFKVFPFNLSDTFSNRSQVDYKSGKYAVTYQELDTVDQEAPVSESDVLHTPRIKKQGIVTRGLRMGNQQDATFNSTLNIKLEGKLSDDVQVEAILSDQEIPFQPEGNTRQIRELDRVYLSLKHDNANLEAGDIGLHNFKKSQYLKYNKQVLGGQVQIKHIDTLAKQATTGTLSVAMAKGQFVSTIIGVQSGVMGPYRLRGNNNETFIMIIAGSERIFLDGKPLLRGFEQDYTIDYNQAEITFTPNLIFNSYSRVKVEYEYIVQDYGRLITTLGIQHKKNNIEAYTNWYKESDLKNNPIAFSANQESLLAFEEAGDSIQSIILNESITQLPEFDASQVLYTLTDSLHNNITYNIYKRATITDNAPFFRPSFVFVGQGNGNYELISGNTNGREYIWIAPVNNRAMGSYDIGQKINAPNLKQMLNLGGKYHLSEDTYAFAEVAFSNQDVNTLSSLHDNDNKGQALKIGLESKNVPLRFSKKYTFSSSFSLERTSSNFRAIDRFRNIEFQRNWGIFNNALDTLQDFIGIASVGINNGKRDYLKYEIAFRHRENQYEGLKHQVSSKQQFGKLGLLANASLLQVNSNAKDNLWKKIKSDINYRTFWGLNGYKFEANKHNFELDRQSLSTSSMSNYQAHSAYVKSLDSAQLNYNLAFEIRNDEQLINADSSLTRNTQTLSMGVQKKGKNSRFTAKLNAMKTQTLTDKGILEENTMSGQGAWHQKLLDNLATQDLRFTTGTGREAKREFVFLNVATGMGTHTWRDNNNNGSQELDEFFEAILPDERNFAKFFVPNNEFVQVYISNFNHKINIAVPQAWLQKSVFEQNTWRDFLAKWSFRNVFNASYRTSGEGFWQRFMPYLSNIPQENLTSGILNWHSTLYFQRNHQKFGTDFQYKNNSRKQLLSSGYEANTNEEWLANTRWQLFNSFTNMLSIGRGKKNRASDFLTNQNYDIQHWFIKPSISFQPGLKWRFTAYYQLMNKTAISNIVSDLSQGSPLQGEIHELSLQLKSNAGKNQQMNLSVSSFKINYAGKDQTALGYEMLQGLRVGINHVFRANLVKRLSNGLQMQVSYTGRKSTGNKLIHTGNVQLSALF